MLKAMTWVAALVLALHGLVHLMGTTVYMRLGEMDGMPYKTTLLDGRWDLGDGGIRVVGAIWAVAAAGFVAAAVGWVLEWGAWQPVLLGATLLSLALTALDATRAPVGIAVNLAILVALWLAPRLAGRRHPLCLRGLGSHFQAEPRWKVQTWNLCARKSASLHLRCRFDSAVQGRGPESHRRSNWLRTCC